jgi:SAM-dependent methyltransferase
MEPIDVKAIIAKFDTREHARRADAYFAGLDERSLVCRRPWASIAEAPELAFGISAVLGGLQLFHGARVLDFGCGLGWMSFLLADLGCQVHALDVSSNALALGEKLSRSKSSNPAAIRFVLYDGKTMDLSDGAVDRIVCFSAFHHVPDQAVVLKEMYRVLAPGGIAAFHEPGPHHSKTLQSQEEMRSFQVIENDIVIEDIWRAAHDVGFAEMRVGYQAPRAIPLSVEEFQRLTSGGDADLARRVVEESSAQQENMRTFFLTKSGARRLDSRSVQGLAHRISISNVKVVSGSIEADLTATNTGGATWLPSGHYVSAVNLGVHLIDAAGASIERDYHRILLLKEPVAPGKEVRQRISIPLPSGRSPGTYAFDLDLVSEGIAWFSLCGSHAVRLSAPGDTFNA